MTWTTVPLDHRGQFVQQPGLADPGVAGQHGEAGQPGQRALPALVQQPELVLAADQPQRAWRPAPARRAGPVPPPGPAARAGGWPLASRSYSAVVAGSGATPSSRSSTETRRW